MRDYNWLVAEISIIWRKYQPSYARDFCAGMIYAFWKTGVITEEQFWDLNQKNLKR